MKRTRRPNTAGNKQFVSGGVYNPNANAKPLIQPPLQAANVVQNQPDTVSQPAPVNAPVPAPAPAPAPVQQKQQEPPQKKTDAASIAAKLPMPILVKEEPVDADADQ
ncbi:uncharacterized protein Dana_GF20931, isoform A [Drosophila ananassae]|uniref:Uncharacterized protein, isoform A n=1 Tax=Drosophila ananassae TaxID=7217 RepID=B3MRT8_DROAN|nr:uncharacterized protein Dana_GF20931, isoform A [Drosophila ananassae]